MSNRKNTKQQKALDITKSLPIKTVDDIVPVEQENRSPYGNHAGLLVTSDKQDHFIPTPQIREIPDYHQQQFTPFIPPVHYIKYHQNSGSLSHNIGVVYDILREDMEWIQNNGRSKISETVFAACIETYERTVYERHYPDYVVEPDSYDKTALLELVKSLPTPPTPEQASLIYSYWVKKRITWTKALMRQYQKPPEPTNLLANVAFRPRKTKQPSRAGARRTEDKVDKHERFSLLRYQILFPFHMMTLVYERERYKQETLLTESELFYLKLRDSKFFKALSTKDDTSPLSLPSLQLGDDYHPTKQPSNLAQLKQLFQSILPQPTFNTPASTLPTIQLGSLTFRKPVVIPENKQSHQQIVPAPLPIPIQPVFRTSDPKQQIAIKIRDLLENDIEPGLTEPHSQLFYSQLQSSQDDNMLHHLFQQQMYTARQNQQDHYWILSQQRMKRQHILIGAQLRANNRINETPLQSALVNNDLRYHAVQASVLQQQQQQQQSTPSNVLPTNQSDSTLVPGSLPLPSSTSTTGTTTPGTATTPISPSAPTIDSSLLPYLTDEDWVQLEQIDQNVFGLQLQLKQKNSFYEMGSLTPTNAGINTGSGYVDSYGYIINNSYQTNSNDSDDDYYYSSDYSSDEDGEYYSDDDDDDDDDDKKYGGYNYRRYKQLRQYGSSGMNSLQMPMIASGGELANIEIPETNDDDVGTTINSGDLDEIDTEPIFTTPLEQLEHFESTNAKSKNTLHTKRVTIFNPTIHDTNENFTNITTTVPNLITPPNLRENVAKVLDYTQQHPDYLMVRNVNKPVPARDLAYSNATINPPQFVATEPLTPAHFSHLPPIVVPPPPSGSTPSPGTDPVTGQALPPKPDLTPFQAILRHYLYKQHQIRTQRIAQRLYKYKSENVELIAVLESMLSSPTKDPTSEPEASTGLLAYLEHSNPEQFSQLHDYLGHLKQCQKLLMLKEDTFNIIQTAMNNYELPWLNKTNPGNDNTNTDTTIPNHNTNSLPNNTNTTTTLPSSATTIIPKPNEIEEVDIDTFIKYCSHLPSGPHDLVVKMVNKNSKPNKSNDPLSILQQESNPDEQTSDLLSKLVQEKSTKPSLDQHISTFDQIYDKYSAQIKSRINQNSYDAHFPSELAQILGNDAAKLLPSGEHTINSMSDANLQITNPTLFSKAQSALQSALGTTSTHFDQSRITPDLPQGISEHLLQGLAMLNKPPPSHFAPIMNQYNPKNQQNDLAYNVLSTPGLTGVPTSNPKVPPQHQKPFFTPIYANSKKTPHSTNSINNLSPQSTLLDQPSPTPPLSTNPLSQDNIYFLPHMQHTHFSNKLFNPTKPQQSGITIEEMADNEELDDDCDRGSMPSVQQLIQKTTSFISPTNSSGLAPPFISSTNEQVAPEILGQTLENIAIANHAAQSKQYHRFQDIDVTIPDMNDILNPFNRSILPQPDHPLTGHKNFTEQNILKDFTPRSYDPPGTTDTYTITKTAISSGEPINSVNLEKDTTSKYPRGTPILPRPVQQKADFNLKNQQDHPFAPYANDLFNGTTAPSDMTPVEYYQTHLLSDQSSTFSYDLGSDLSFLETIFKTRDNNGKPIAQQQLNFGQTAPKTGTYIDPNLLVQDVAARVRQDRINSIESGHQKLLGTFNDLRTVVKNYRAEFGKLGIDLPTIFASKSKEWQEYERDIHAQYNTDLAKFRDERDKHQLTLEKHQEELSQILEQRQQRAADRIKIANGVILESPPPPDDSDLIDPPKPELRPRPNAPTLPFYYGQPVNAAIESILMQLKSSQNAHAFLFDLDYEYALSERLWYGINRLSSLVQLSPSPYENITADGDSPFNPFAKFDTKTTNTKRSGPESPDILPTAPPNTMPLIQQVRTINSLNPTPPQPKMERGEVTKSIIKDVFSDPAYFALQQAQSHVEKTNTSYPTLTSFVPSNTADGRPFQPTKQLLAQGLNQANNNTTINATHQDVNDSTNGSELNQFTQSIEQLLAIDHLPQLHARLDALPLPTLDMEPHPLMTSDTYPIHPFVMMQRLETNDGLHVTPLLNTLVQWREKLIVDMKRQLDIRVTDAQQSRGAIPNTSMDNEDKTVLSGNNDDPANSVQISDQIYRDKEPLYIALQWLTYYHIQQHLAGLAPSLQLPMIDELLHYAHVYYEKFSTNIRVGQRIDLVYNQTHYCSLQPPHQHDDIQQYLGSSIYHHPIFNSTMKSLHSMISTTPQEPTNPQVAITTMTDGNHTASQPHPSTVHPPQHPSYGIPSAKMVELEYFFRYGQFGRKIQPQFLLESYNHKNYAPKDPVSSLVSLYTDNTLVDAPQPTNCHYNNSSGTNNNIEHLITTVRNTIQNNESVSLCQSRDEVLALNQIPRSTLPTPQPRGPLLTGHIIPRVARGDREVHDLFTFGHLQSTPFVQLSPNYDPTILHNKIIAAIKLQQAEQLKGEQQKAAAALQQAHQSTTGPVPVESTVPSTAMAPTAGSTLPLSTINSGGLPPPIALIPNQASIPSTVPIPMAVLPQLPLRPQ